MNGEDPFGFALAAGQVSKSQEELLGHQPILGGSLPSSDGEDHSPEERYGPSSPLLMVSLPDSQDDVSAENTHQDLFHTPPEETVHELGASAVNRTVQADTEMTDVGDSCGGYSEERPLVDLSKGSGLGVSEMEVVIEKTVTTETCLVGFSEMLLENELQLKDGLGDLTDQSPKFPEEISKYSATGNVNAVANSKGKEVACAGNVSRSMPTVRDGNKQLSKGRSDGEEGNVCGGSTGKKEALFIEDGPPGVRQKVRTRSEDEELKDFEVADSKGKEVACADNVSPSMPTVRDGNKQLLKGRSDGEEENVCGGSTGKKEVLFVEEGPSGVRQKVRTRNEDEELKDFEVAKRVEDKCIFEAAQNVESIAMEAEDHHILRMLPMSLKKLPENEPSAMGLDSEMKESQQRVETGKLNRKSTVNESAEEVSKENSVKWVEDAVASANEKLVSLPMPLLEWIKNTKRNLNSKKEGSVGQEGESSLLDLLKRVEAYTDDREDIDEVDDDLDGLGLLRTLKRRGVTFPRPRWWSDEIYKNSKLKEFTN